MSYSILKSESNKMIKAGFNWKPVRERIGTNRSMDRSKIERPLEAQQSKRQQQENWNIKLKLTDKMKRRVKEKTYKPIEVSLDLLSEENTPVCENRSNNKEQGSAETYKKNNNINSTRSL